MNKLENELVKENRDRDTDKDKKRHIVSNICPHMKCNLVFNYLDKTWDCPCHASRFDIDGNLINGPSVFDIKIK